jgi:hypothetical protein
MRKILATWCFALFMFAWPACAQSPPQEQHGTVVQGVAIGRSTIPSGVAITTGNTFQQLLPSVIGTTTQRQSLTIQNNNTSTDNCWILIGGPWKAGDTTSTTRTVAGASITTIQAAILLQPGQPYTRYWPYVPYDQILGTCVNSTSDSIYVDNQ